MQVILAIVSITLCRAAEVKKSQKRGLHDEFTAGYSEPPEHDISSDWNAGPSEWSLPDASDWASDPEETEPTAEEEEPHNEAAWDDEPTQSWSNAKSPQSWYGSHSSQSWPNAHSWPSPSSWPHHGSVKTIVKKIPVPYERPIKIDNPVYKTVEKHVPIDYPVPIVKWVEKPIPKYVDHPIPVPVIKEEHVPQPYEEKVRVVVQKVFVHVPQRQQTIIIRKKHRHLPEKKHKFFGFL